MKAKISFFLIFGLVFCLWVFPSLAQKKADITLVQKQFDAYNTRKCEILSRIQVGDWIVDEEHITGVNMDGFPTKIRAAVVYRIKDSKITYVRFSR